MFATKKGFTLVELLVTVSIIAVLMVIVIPELQRYRQRFYDTTALSDLNQFTKAVANTDTPAFFINWITTPGTHPNFPEVKISNEVNILDVSIDTGLGWVWYAWGCHLKGETGYFLYIPYGTDPWGGWMVPNQIQESPAYRWLCP
ncbi:MAG: prepilin-type N-terminal cleavage/methylation domain-containing protein [Nitrospinae bacterium]|nr:prepilin-type N-terminal cleavage/methylation domain-containing protein [Nitrospinota bacterium]